MDYLDPVSGTFVFLMIAFIFAVRLVAGFLDKQRIEAEIVEKGGEVHSIRWTPFAKGWLGSKNERLYQAFWTDSSGVRHSATVKTAMLAGNYFADSSSSSSPKNSADRQADLQTENQRLRQEVDRLRGELDQLRRDRM